MGGSIGTLQVRLSGGRRLGSFLGSVGIREFRLSGGHHAAMIW